MKHRIGDIVTKSLTVKPLKAKAADGDNAGLEEGEFLAYASVFGVKDLDGDVVEPTAFDKTLAEWKSSDNLLPMLWGHNTSDPDMNLGDFPSAEVDEHGLLVKGRIDLEGPKGPQAYRLIKGGRVRQLSYSYRITKGEYVIPRGEENADKEPYFRIDEVDLFEISLVQIGANQETEILAVKAATGALQTKAGRALSSKNEEALRGALAQAEEIVTALKDVLPSDDSGDGDEEDQDETSGKEPSSTDSKSVTTMPSPSVYLALLELESI
ncbi:HK97 family phage prohead protease [Mycolicibacterium fluoranthenivorans]|uniref:Prohead serine protease domain-containing protein n=1 Tax=Mycolicibacterium fluoranthenivorans TaxID=258505 RepID=A0A1G4VFA4_9MYCO|nr:HK97 family phage prohead protease [Mycolicibacterium fluoranthenivorans]SCX05945.1 hypothetical protein SAMN02799620_00785 [Mycolicibacterium fluoranthenivorans]